MSKQLMDGSRDPRGHFLDPKRTIEIVQKKQQKYRDTTHAQFHFGFLYSRQRWDKETPTHKKRYIELISGSI